MKITRKAAGGGGVEKGKQMKPRKVRGGLGKVHVSWRCIDEVD